MDRFLAGRRGWTVILVVVVFYTILVIVAARANFVPSGVKGWVVVLASCALGLSLPVALPRARISRLSSSNQRWVKFYFWLFGALLWVPIVGLVLPVASSFVYATPVEKVLTVAAKRSPSRRVSCHGLVLQEYQQLMDNTICVSAELWESLASGARIRVSAMENGLGFRIDEIHRLP